MNSTTLTAEDGRELRKNLRQKTEPIITICTQNFRNVLKKIISKANSTKYHRTITGASDETILSVFSRYFFIIWSIRVILFLKIFLVLRSTKWYASLLTQITSIILRHAIQSISPTSATFNHN